MYIKEITIKNIRGIKQFNWELHNDELAGWHVIIGDNGSGKTTLLRAIALGLLGQRNADRMIDNWHDWLKQGTKRGGVELRLYDSDAIEAGSPESPYLDFGITIETDNKEIRLKGLNNDSGSADYGVFSVAFGPFRRFQGGMRESSYTNPQILATLSLFREHITFEETLLWLKDLDHKRVSNQSFEAELLESITKFINQDDFLPQNIKLGEVSYKGVFFVDNRNYKIPIENLGDGYRSTLIIILEILRQLYSFYTIDNPYVNRSTWKIFSQDYKIVEQEGIVLIDEIDAHLHPSWQRTIGASLTKLFPNIQFIVTTHSPLVCQLPADENGRVRGSIWRLPTLGNDEKAYRVHEKNPQTAEEWKRLVYGNILEAYSTDLFGENIDRSKVAQEKLERVSELSMKQMDAPLKPEEKKELDELMDELPATSTTYTFRVGVNDD